MKPLRVLDVALALIIFAVPLAWTKYFIAEFTLAKFAILNAAVFLAALCAAFRPTVLAAGETGFEAPLLAGLFIACLSAAASDDPLTSLLGRYDSYAYGLWALALFAAVFQVAARSARTREARIARWLTVSAALVGGYAVLQKAGIDPVLHLKDLPSGGRAVSMLGSPVDLGALLALVWPIALWRVDAERRPTAVILAACVAGGLLACGSRGAWLAAGVGAAAYWLISRREALRSSLAIAVACAGSAIAWSCRSGASVADIGRREVWITAYHVFLRSPLLGCGPDGFEDAFRALRTSAFVAALGPLHRQAYAHNDILHVLANLGLAGAAVYAALLFALVKAAKRAMRTPETRALGAALTAGLLALWVNLEVNPTSIEIFAFTAVAAGLLCSLTASPSPAFFSRAPFVLASALTAYAFAYSLGMAGADKNFKAGAEAQAAGDFASAKILFAQARRSEPCEMSYMVGEVNALGDWINATHDVTLRLALLARARETARMALSCHPRQFNSHYLAGTVSRMHADLGFKDELIIAAREFDQALPLDPHFEPLLAARAELQLRLKPSP